MSDRKGLKTACATLVAALALGIPAAGAGPTDGWAWKHRVLVIFAKDDSDNDLAEQRRRLAGVEPDITERQMAVIEIVGGEAKAVLGADVDVSAAEMKTYLRKDDARFEVFLLGKDTGIKLRASEPVSANTVFSLIDTMPMRRQEMRERGG